MHAYSKVVSYDEKAVPGKQAIQQQASARSYSTAPLQEVGFNRKPGDIQSVPENELIALDNHYQTLFKKERAEFEITMKSKIMCAIRDTEKKFYK